MKRTFFLLLYVLPMNFTAVAQDEPQDVAIAIVESVDVSGVSADRLSPELREQMQRLVGQPMDQLAADEVAFRMQSELFRRITAIREVPGSSAGQVRLTFDFGEDESSNVNARYTIESAGIEGIPLTELSPDLRSRISDLENQRLRYEVLRTLERRIRGEVRRRSSVNVRVRRGSQSGRVTVTFEVGPPRWLAFQKQESNILYHSRQSFTGNLNVPITFGSNRITLGGGNDSDLAIERLAGYRLGFETISAGTPRIGLSFQYSTYRDQWKLATRVAASRSPEALPLYRAHRRLEPSVTVAVSRDLRVDAGISLTEFEMERGDVEFRNANAATTGIAFDRGWEEDGEIDHNIAASYRVRTASRNLESDFVFTRHDASVTYHVTRRRNEFIAAFIGGSHSGQAPLLDRFSLGNTRTLRGWNKFDVAPAGGNRMSHLSLEYRWRPFQVFYDTGAVWDSGSRASAKHAIGFGFQDRDNWFLTLGFPIRSGSRNPIFMMGVRF